jgi:cytochrome P450/ferredoxin-NADP reductase
MTVNQTSGRGGCPVDHSGIAPNGCPVSAKAATFDVFDEPYQTDPAASLRWARDEEPVFYSASLGYWIVTRYEDIKAVFRDNRVFSPSIALEKITPPTQEATEILQRHGYAMGRTMVNEEEPTHMERRRVLLEPFTPAELGKHELMVRRLTREYVDRFIDTGEADLVDEMLWEIPLTVGLHFLGVPEEDMATLRRFSVAHTVNNWGRPTPTEQVAVAEAVGQFWEYAGKVIEKIRRDPSGPGWMPFTVRAQQDHPDLITDSYLHSVMMAVIVAAHETTANAAGNAMRLLLENREVWEEICADPSLIPNAVEECLRMGPSVASWRRIVTEETQLGGVRLPAGSKLLIVMASANRDERKFGGPDELDIRRDNASEHLAFGYGSHQCMGKNLARMELQIFLEELTTRLPHMSLVPGQRFTYLPNTSFRGPEHVWARWDPARNPERSDPAVLHRVHTTRLGEPSKKTIFRTVRVAEIHREAQNVVRVRLVDAAGKPLPKWTPGAHVEIECGTLARQYSLCGKAQDQGFYEIAVLREPESRGGSRFVHEQLAEGDLLTMRGPRTHFSIDPTAQHYVLIAGGIGITPIISMADQLKEHGRSYEVHYAGRDLETMAFVDRLRSDHEKVTTLYPGSANARLDVAALLADPAPATQVYACGPDRLLAAVEAAMKSWPDDALRVERFATDGVRLDPAVERSFDIELVDSALTLRVGANRTVLQTLRSAGVDIQSDCEEGLCGACEVSVLDGEVDHRDRVLSKAERARGAVMMSCCSRAVSGRLRLRI